MEKKEISIIIRKLSDAPKISFHGKECVCDFLWQWKGKYVILYSKALYLPDLRQTVNIPV